MVREESAPINGLGRLIIGSKPIDGGYYIFNAAERSALLDAEPAAAAWLRPFIGAREYLQGGERWILALHDAPPEVLARLPGVRERIAAVRAYREASKSAPTRKLAATPTLYHVNVIPTTPFLVIPEVSSERREYAPIGWLEPPVIPSNKLRLLANATLTDFALLTSAMHMAWTRYIGGRLKSDYSYSVGVNYNTFPLPPKDSDLSRLEPFGQAVLDARATHPDATLADLYAPDLMPPTLRRAHQALDHAVDRLYRRAGFASERERVEHLFMLYEKMRAPLDLAARGRARRNDGDGCQHSSVVGDSAHIGRTARVEALHHHIADGGTYQSLMNECVLYNMRHTNGSARLPTKREYKICPVAPVEGSLSRSTQR